MAYLKTLLFATVVPGVVVVLVPYLLLSRDFQLLAFRVGEFRYVGILLMALSGVGWAWGAFNFAHVGKGTPSPFDPPKRLVR